MRNFENFDLTNIQVTGSTGIDSLLQREPHMIRPTGRRKVASLGDISSFLRVSSNTLVHKSDRDLWAIQKEADGNFYIERLFDDNGQPIKG